MRCLATSRDDYIRMVMDELPRGNSSNSLQPEPDVWRESYEDDEDNDSFVDFFLENTSMPANTVPIQPKQAPYRIPAEQENHDDEDSDSFDDYYLENTYMPANTVPIRPKQVPRHIQIEQTEEECPAPDKEVFKPYDLFKYLLQRYSFGVRISAKRFIASYLYLYSEKNGKYSHLLPHEFDSFVRGIKDLPEGLKDVINSHFLMETYRWLCSSKRTQKLPQKIPSNMINVLNGTLMLDKKAGRISLVPNDKKFLLFNSIKAAWVPCTEEQWKSSRTYRFLKRFSHPDYGEKGVNYLAYMLGKIFTNIRTGKSIYYIYGPTDVGKGRLCRLIVSILGEENCKELDLSAFLDRFGPVELLDRMLNISYDENTETWSKKLAAMLKKISAHDPMRGDIKNRQPISFTPNAILLCFGNEKPLYAADVDAGGAVSNRLNCFRTGDSVPKEEQEPDLAEQLEREKNLVFSYCVRYFITHDEPEKLEQDISGQRINFANITAKQGFKMWAEDQVVKVVGNILGSEDFYQSYMDYLEANEITEALKLRQFQMAFADLYRKYKGPRVDNKVRYYGLGIASNENGNT